MACKDHALLLARPQRRWWLLFFAMIFVPPVVGLGGESGFIVIVNAKVPIQKLQRKRVSDLFLKKTKFWENGLAVRPVDSNINSATRAAFSDKVLDRSVSAIKFYWQQAIFSGRDVPPPELDGDERIIKYVRDHEGAIGYISSGANSTGVKTIVIE